MLASEHNSPFSMKAEEPSYQPVSLISTLVDKKEPVNIFHLTENRHASSSSEDKEPAKKKRSCKFF